jgi:hypothetical protein
MGSKIELFENAQAHWPKAGTPGGGCLVARPALAKGKVRENVQEFAESKSDALRRRVSASATMVRTISAAGRT